MNSIVKNEYLVYLEKSKSNSVKESWVKINLPNLYNYIINRNGSSLSEKIYLLHNSIGKCKVCENSVKFLSIERGYREYCSKKCSNNDKELIDSKLKSYKKTCMSKWGVDNSSKSDNVKTKIKESKKNINYELANKRSKETFLKNWGVDNPSKSETIKQKKRETNLNNWGVDNPFQSEEIKEKIREKNIERFGFNHPLKSIEIKERIKETNIKKYGVDNFTKTKEYKELIFEKYRSGLIKTNLNTDINYHSYIGLGRHLLKCDIGHDHIYETNSHLYHSRIGRTQCTVCYPVNSTSSFKEKELYDFIKLIYSGEIITSYRSGLEIDIYLPELKIGFEFNGLYWHSELFKDKNYHLDKTKYFKENGIRIIHVWEDDWDYKKDIIKSQIKNWLGLIENKIYARKCEVKIVKSIDEYKKFLNDNHIQGFISSSVKIGLYHNDELVSLMTFDHFEGRKKMKDDEWNLSRFCNKINYNIIGGASKLLNYFTNKYKPSRIISFSDMSWSLGNIYYNLGFEVKNISSPNYSYLIDGKRSNKQKWKKSNLIKLGHDKSLTESKIMEDFYGSYKIFDCGQIKFEKVLLN